MLGQAYEMVHTRSCCIIQDLRDIGDETRWWGRFWMASFLWA